MDPCRQNRSIGLLKVTAMFCCRKVLAICGHTSVCIGVAILGDRPQGPHPSDPDSVDSSRPTGSILRSSTVPRPGGLPTRRSTCGACEVVGLIQSMKKPISTHPDIWVPQNERSVVTGRWKSAAYLQGTNLTRPTEVKPRCP